MALTGIQRYLENYAALADKKLQGLNESQKQSIQSMKTLRNNLIHISKEAPKDLGQALQLVLSIYNCLQLTGEPVSLGRMDFILRKFNPKTK